MTAYINIFSILRNLLAAVYTVQVKGSKHLNSFVSHFMRSFFMAMQTWPLQRTWSGGYTQRRKVSKATKIVSRRVKGRLIKSRINQTRIYFGIPVEKIMKKLQERGFVKTYTRPDGKAKVVSNAITK